MENASKALIIAGAILVSILLISVGIIIMNAINDPVQQGAGAAESQAVEMFNSKFITYEGKQKASSLKNLVSTVNASNAKDSDHIVVLTTDGATSISELKASKEYDVKVYYHGGEEAYANKGTKTLSTKTTVSSEEGYICEICITGTTTTP